MEEGTKTKKTVFIGGIGDDVDEGTIFEAFQTFGIAPCAPSRYFTTYLNTGDILEVQIPSAPANPNTPSGKAINTRYLSRY